MKMMAKSTTIIMGVTLSRVFVGFLGFTLFPNFGADNTQSHRSDGLAEGVPEGQYDSNLHTY